MSASGRNDNTGSGDEAEEESVDAKIDRLTLEIVELKVSLVEDWVTEASDEWFRIKTEIKDRDVERLLLIEKKRCDDVVKEYFEENPHVLEAVPECPVCLEKMWHRSGTTQYLCCGKRICTKCASQGGSVFNICPYCRGKAPGANETMAVTKEKSD